MKGLQYMANPQPSDPHLGKIMRFTNITDKDFTHAFGGQPFFVKAGESVMLPYHLAKHLAKHLSRRIYLDKDTSLSAYDPNDKTAGVGKPLWDDDQEQAMMVKILGETLQEGLPEEKTEMQLLKEKVDELQKRFGNLPDIKPDVLPADAGTVPNQDVGNTVAPDVKAMVASTNGYRDKAEVIAELVKRQIPYDARQSKAKLEALLTN